MTRFEMRGLPILVVLAGILMVSGCAKKATQAPPEPAAAPPAQPVPTPTPAPPIPDTTQAPAPVMADISSKLLPAFFDLDSYTLNDQARAALDADAKVLRDNAGASVTIEGHCDERGTAEYNQALGERRAGAARDYLVAAGIDASRLQVISYGKERPFAEGHDESAWSQNRRAHFAAR